MIAEAAIVGMLLNGHDLNAVIAILDDTRQHILLELTVGTHLLGILSHTNMALVDQQRVLIRFERLAFPLVRLLRVPHLCRENLGVLVLYHPSCPGWDALPFSTVPAYMHLIQVAVLHGLVGQFQFPVTCSCNALGLVFLVLLPVIEIAHKVDLRSIRCPFAEHPTACCLVQAKIIIPAGKVLQRFLPIACQLVNLPYGMVVPAADSLFERFQITVVLYQSDVFGRCLLGCRLLGCLFLPRCHNNNFLGTSLLNTIDIRTCFGYFSCLVFLHVFPVAFVVLIASFKAVTVLILLDGCPMALTVVIGAAEL